MKLSINLLNIKPTVSKKYLRIEATLKILSYVVTALSVISGLVLIVIHMILRYQTNQLVIQKEAYISEYRQNAEKEQKYLLMTAYIDSVQGILDKNIPYEKLYDQAFVISEGYVVTRLSFDDQTKTIMNIDIPNIAEAFTFTQKLIAEESLGNISNIIIQSFSISQSGTIQMSLSYRYAI